MVVRTTTTQTKTKQIKENTETNKQTQLTQRKTFNADFCENSHRKDDHS